MMYAPLIDKQPKTFHKANNRHQNREQTKIPALKQKFSKRPSTRARIFPKKHSSYTPK